MVGRWRVLGLERAFAPGAVACLMLGTGACMGQMGHSGPLPDRDEGAGAVGSMASSAGGSPGARGRATGGSAGASGASGEISSGATGGLGCSLPPLEDQAVFAEQAIDGSKLSRRELFSWTSDEQAAALRRDRVLFSQSERPGMGRGYAFDVFARIALDETTPERAELATVLGGALFEKARFAWSEPWATRMGWPGEEYGGNLLRIVLKPEAWVVVVKNGDLTVFDLEDAPVSLAQALANPERLGAIFYQRDAFAGGPSCGSFGSDGGNGYREFIVGNLAMVEEWSLGTEQIRARLSANIVQLITFLERIRACPVTSSAQQWNFQVTCSWDFLEPELTELSAYEQALAIPSENYLAVPDRIAAMIDTLQGDLFELDPLVVIAGSP